MLVTIQRVELGVHDHCNGLCSYRALIEGIQCVTHGVFLDGSVIAVPPDHGSLLAECGPVLLRVLVALYEMRQDFDPAVFTSLDGVAAGKAPSGLELMQALYVALSYYERALEEALLRGAQSYMVACYEHDRDTCVQGRKVLDRFIRGDSIRIASHAYAVTMIPPLASRPN